MDIPINFSVDIVFDGMFTIRHDNNQITCDVVKAREHDPIMTITPVNRQNLPIDTPYEITDFSRGINVFIEGVESQAGVFGNPDVDPFDNTANPNAFGWILNLSRHHPGITRDPNGLDGTIAIQQGTCFADPPDDDIFFVLFRADRVKWAGRRALTMRHRIEMKPGQVLQVSGGPGTPKRFPYDPNILYQISISNQCQNAARSDFGDVYGGVNLPDGDSPYKLFAVLPNGLPKKWTDPAIAFDKVKASSDLFPCVITGG